MKFCVNSPTTKMKASVSTAPRPGRRKPNRRSGCHARGSSSSVWSIVPMIEPEHPQRDGQRHQHQQASQEHRFERRLFRRHVYRQKAARAEAQRAACAPPRRAAVLLGAAGPARTRRSGRCGSRRGRRAARSCRCGVRRPAASDCAAPLLAPAFSPEAPFEAPLASGLAGALLPPLPPRKSVTYQPEPFNWKPAAVTCLRNVSFPHSGHCVNWRVADLLKHVLPEAARFATISVDRHDLLPY